MEDPSDRLVTFELPPDVEAFPTISSLTGKKVLGAWRSIVYSDPRNSIRMSSKATESAVDRLIALATEEKPAEPKTGNSQERTDLEQVQVFSESTHELEHNPMWKSLLQFRALLPYISRLLEMSHPEPSPALTAELKQSIGDLAVAQRDLRVIVQDQFSQMKHLEEEMTRAREAAERTVTENLEMVEDIRSVQSTLKKAAFGVGALLLVLIGLVVWVLVRFR